MDRLTAERRSWLMSRIRGKHTAPEMSVRKTLHAMGLRYRLHAPDLPGKPDIVFRSRRIAIFVHGCFWHGHRCRYKPSGAKSNKKFWSQKIEGNRARDRRNIRRLRAAGWKVFVIWECKVRKGTWLKILRGHFPLALPQASESDDRLSQP